MERKAKPLGVNTSQSVGDRSLLRILIEKHRWVECTGRKGQLHWHGNDVVDSQILENPNITANRFPEMRRIANKRYFAEILRLTAKHYPEVEQICPRTYLLPRDLELLEGALAQKGCTFIIKPEAGSQGDGIYLINHPRDLGKVRSRSLDDMVAQEYISRPLLINHRKFDLRLYVLVTSLDPLVVYLNEEGLGRFCTQDYKAPSGQNLQNIYMHLTNYSVNKHSSDFVHTEELTDSNDATKQTLSSVFAALEEAGTDTELIRQRLRNLVSDSMELLKPWLLAHCSRYQSKRFHILGLDVIIDRNLRPWLLELNSTPSLLIDSEVQVRPGVVKLEQSPVDFAVKSNVVADAIKLSVQRLSSQLQRERYRSYTRILPTDEDKFPIFCQVWDIYKKIGNGGEIKQIGFRKFYKIAKEVDPQYMGADLDILFISVSRKRQSCSLDFLGFIYAIEELASRLWPSQDPIRSFARLIEEYWHSE